MAEEMDIKQLKSRYATVKLVLKKWEASYKSEHGERPSKEALHLAPPDIKDAYKSYWRLTKHLSSLKNDKIILNDSNNIESSSNNNHSFKELKASNDIEVSSNNNHSFKELKASNDIEVSSNNNHSFKELKASNDIEVSSNNNHSFKELKASNDIEVSSNNNHSFKELKASNDIEVSSNNNHSFKELKASDNLEKSSSSEEACHSSLSHVDSITQSSQSNVSDVDTCRTKYDRTTLQLARNSSVCDNSVKHCSTDSFIVSNKEDISGNEDLRSSGEIYDQNAFDSDKSDMKNTKSTSQVAVWGKHLNKIDSEPNESVDVEVSLYSKMAKKMKSNAIIKTRTSLKRVQNKIMKENKEKKTERSFVDKEQENSSQNGSLWDDTFNTDVNNFNADVVFSPNKQTESTKRSTQLNVPNFCVVKKRTTKSNSRSVNHFSLNKLTESKIENRGWNNNWVKRCTDYLNEQEINPVKQKRLAEDKCDSQEVESVKKRTEAESTNSNNSSSFDLITRNDGQLIQSGDPDGCMNMKNSGNLCKRNISSRDTDGCAKKSTEAESMNSSNNSSNFDLINRNEAHLIQTRDPDEGHMSKKDSVILFKRKLSQRDTIGCNEVEESREVVTSNVDMKDEAIVEDKDLFSFEDEEYQPEPKRKKLVQRNRVTNKLKNKTKTKDKPSTLKTRSRTKKITNDNDNKVGISKESVNENALPEYDELEAIGCTGAHHSAGKSKRYFSKEERMQHKVANGKLNDNFVKINLKKKVFVRGKRRMTSEKHKRIEWKKKQIEKKAEGGDERSIKKLTCYRCGDFGHWANKCPGKIGDRLMSLDAYNEQESTFLTLEEAADLASGKTSNVSNERITKVYKNEEKNMPSTNSDQQNGKEVMASTNSDEEIFSDWDDDFIASLEVNDKNVTKNTYNNLDRSLPVKDLNEQTENPVQSVRPLYNLDSDGNVMATTSEVLETLHLFGHKSFRKGQETVVMRVLSGQSTLVVQSTGSGKSLCYQLPAYLYSKHFNCITLCVSPLVSLMEDQVTGLPSILNAVCLHTQQSPSNREKAMNSLRSGDVHILLVSPEAIVSSRGGGVLGALLKELPPVAFACLDEAHCLSEWSHNFRPSYLQVCQILKERFHVDTFLGLTATARKETAVSIAKHLQIVLFNQGVIMGACIPDNLVLSVSRDAKREEALIHLLTGDRFEGCSSIIIYCTRRDECERISTFIRTQMVIASKIDVKSNAKRNRGFSLDAEAYHAGLSGYRRQQIQKRFMSGKLRIVVATVAFGMGIDKADVQGIIHFNMPRNLESYVQEIGRAGRDGNTAHCHLFLDNSEGKDIQELKRHIFVNSVDRFTVRKLLNKIFAHQNCVKVTRLLELPNSSQDTEDLPESSLQDRCDNENMSEDKERKGTCSTSSMNNISCPGHEVALPMNDLIESLDLPEENIQTLLCYMKMHPKCRLQLSHHAYATCSVSCYSGAKQLCSVSKKCPPLAVAVALQRKQGKKFEKVNSITFPVVEISSQMGWNSRIVKQELKNLEWINTGLGIKPSGVKVEFSDLGFHMTCRCDLSDEEQDQLLEDIYERACRQEKDQLKQLQYTYKVLSKASHSSIILCCDQVDEEKGDFLKGKIGNYFGFCNEDGLGSIQLEEQLYIRPEIEQRIRQDIRSLLSIHSDQSWTGRAVARVFHGISSPNFPSKVWGRVRKFWRLHLETDFNLLLRIATKEILKFR